ncbi:hypothetical protein CWC11_14555 [Pseudoalteromonas sp. S3178]|uniref:sulfatase-like hydrolase/transferase n=1 Tax=Pseudoalteromonas sp. S3178 TaxID=579532 RepID=UPI00110A0E94|nr:sulfatase-like hydrolase/transferase [Pseudoalteromonas sp. S3178]TMP03195.1 hypothetical protein CWC11_14555 [Pseudoalteromonas sp. S3178]
MIINIFISFLFFFLSFYHWYSHLSTQNLNIKSLEQKLSNAFFNYAFMLEVLIFMIGILLSIVLIGFIGYVASDNLKKLSKNKLSTTFCLVVTWAALLTATMSLSSYFYPDLFFSHPSLGSELTLVASLAFVLAQLLITTINTKRIKIMVVTVVTLIAAPEIPNLTFQENTQEKKMPNIFIIGIDSLNQNEINSTRTPFLYDFINKSTYLPHSYTHVARTFPSWVSILTGDYPLKNKARLNLTNFDRIDLTKTLPYYLNKAGYKNYFIQDERRFSNIDERFFFDQVLGPPATAAEFLLSKLVDLPLLALTSKLNFFHYFMPHLQNNRANWVTYDPRRFNKEISSNLYAVKEPVFIASHFTLPHWPYKINNQTTHLNNNYDKYLQSIEMADKQVSHYIKLLKNKNLLNNSLVFIVSDHGESFARSEDIPNHNHNLKSLNLAGHGTSIVSNSQYKILLTFKYFKDSTSANLGEFNNNLNYALSDITPTILDILDLNVERKFDGNSMLKVKEQRDMPIESSLQPMFNSKGTVDVNGTIEQNANLYEIDSSGKMIVKDELYQKAVNSKQRGVIFDKWQLSIYPEHNNEIYITDLKNHNLYTYAEFYDKNLRKNLLNKLCQLYSEEALKANIEPCLSLSYINQIPRKVL